MGISDTSASKFMPMLNCPSDDNVEVREMASNALSGIVRYRSAKHHTLEGSAMLSRILPPHTDVDFRTTLLVLRAKLDFPPDETPRRFPISMLRQGAQLQLTQNLRQKAHTVSTQALACPTLYVTVRARRCL